MIHILPCHSFSSILLNKTEQNDFTIQLSIIITSAKHWLSSWISYKIFRLFPVIASNWFLSDLCYQIRKNPMDGTSPILSNPTSSDTSNWGVLSWNPVSSQATNSDHFLIPDNPESRRMRTDPKIGSDRFRLYESDRNAVNSISGYQRKIVDMTGIRWEVTDRIRLPVWQRIWYPSDRIRRTHFDLGLSFFFRPKFVMRRWYET